MIQNRFTALCSAAAMTLIAPATFGNDIADFLRAVNGPRHHGHHADHDGHGFQSHHSVHHSRSRRFRSHGFQRYHRSVSIHIGRSTRPSIYGQRPVIVGQIQQAPPPSSIGTLPHEYGEIVTCDVALESHVRIRNAHEIAPGAQPIIVAVRNPHLAAWGSHACVEALSYIQVFAPPIPLRDMSVSPCGTRIVLDYGDWEIKIRSCDGVIEVEYDD